MTSLSHLKKPLDYAGSRRLQNILLVLWVIQICAVVVGSLLPANVMNGVPLPNDKLMHSSAYFMLALVPIVGIERGRMGVLAALGMTLLGALLEYGQSFVPGRTPEPADMMANDLGVVAGVLLGLAIKRVRWVSKRLIN